MAQPGHRLPRGDLARSATNRSRPARELGLQKIVARMAPEQRGATQVFERLGFRAEALLGDYVMDREGRTHDLIVMSYDVTGLTE